MMDRRTFLGTATLLAGEVTVLRAQEKPVSKPKSGKHLAGKGLCIAPDFQAAVVGAEMLQRGGNAFDALIAAAFMEAVISPANCGIGGYAATGIAFDAKAAKVVAIDANAVAPAAATPEIFPVISTPGSFDYKLPDGKHKTGVLSVAVPGVLAGLLHWVDRFGSLDRRTIMGPAIRQARDGIRLDKVQSRTWLQLRAEGLGEMLTNLAEIPDVIPMDELADSLEAIAEEGVSVFYSGHIGRTIVDHLRKRGGILTNQDFEAYLPLDVNPVSVNVRQHQVFAPPPSSGGLTSLQMAALYDRLAAEAPLPKLGTAESIEFSIEIAKAVWAERLTTLGDPRAMTVEPQSLLEESHLNQLLARIREGLRKPSPGKLIAPDPLRGTVHLIAADAAGNVVSWTQTHGGGFGSRVMVPGTGIVLGHGMCRFEPRPGWVNSVGPGKRPLHNMCPVLGLREGKPVIAAGAAGGRTIVNNSAALLINRLINGLNAVDSVTTPRVQCESLEPALLEETIGDGVVNSLRDRGHLVKTVPRDAGTAHLLVRDQGEWHGAAESRVPKATVAAPGD